MNYVVLVGKVVTRPELRETTNGSMVASLEVEVERNFPNSEGKYETDVFLVTLWKGLAEASRDNCEVDSVVGVKGRLIAKQFDTKEGSKFHYCEIVAEKLSLITK